MGLTGAHAELLQKVDLFAGLDRMALAQVAAFVEAVAVEGGSTIFRQGEPGDALFIVARGRFGVFVALPESNTEVRLATLSPGDVFGEMALLTDEPRSATVRSEDGTGELLKLERSRFFELVRREPALIHSIAGTLIRRLQANAQLILQSEHFIVSVVEGALGRVDPARRRQILEASVLDDVGPEALAALFGADAAEVARTLGECGIVPGQPAGPVLRILRERLERELGAEYWQEFAQTAAGRLAEAGLWSAALPLYARHAPRDVFIAALGRGVRAAPPPAPEQIAPWLDRTSDEEVAQDVDLALAKAALYEERGAPAAALLLLERALGAALTDQRALDARRLSDEIARLTLATGAEPAGALQYGLQPARARRVFRPGTRALLVGVALAFAAAAFAVPAPPARFGLLLAAAVVLWVIDVLPNAAVSLLLLASWILTGLTDIGGATAGFGSTNWLFVLALLGIAAAIARSGLLFRIGLLLIRRMPQGLFWQAGTLLLTGVLLGPFLPVAMGRAALTAPLALGVAQALRLEDREPAAAVLGLASWIGAGPMLFAFLNASPACLLAWGLLPAATRQRFDWVQWLIAAAPLALLIGVGSLIALFLVFRPRTRAVLARDRLALQLAVLGPPSQRELAMAAVLLLTVAGWLAAPRLGLDAGTVAILGVLAAFLTGNLDGRSLRDLDWNYLIFYGVALSLSGLMGALGIERLLSDTARTFLADLGITPATFVLLIAVMSLLAAVAIGEQTVLLLGLAVVPIASAIGVSPWVAVMAILATVVYWLIPATTPEYLVAHAAAEGRLYSHAQAQRAALAHVAVVLAALALAVPFWRYLGLM